MISLQSSIADAAMFLSLHFPHNEFFYSWQWDLNFKGSDEDETRGGSKSKPAPRKTSPPKKQRTSLWDTGTSSNTTSNKKAKPVVTDARHVFQTLPVDDDASQSDDLMCFDGKKSRLEQSRKTLPKKETLTAAKMKAAAAKPVKRPYKSVCDLSSDDEGGVYDFLDDRTIGSNADSLKSEGSDDIIMKDVAFNIRSSRRSRDDESSEEEFNDGSNVE